MTTFVALGDSITVGMGDPTPGGGWRGWAALLAGSLHQPEMHNLARLGALAADVERVQLPAATALRRATSISALAICRLLSSALALTTCSNASGVR